MAKATFGATSTDFHQVLRSEVYQYFTDKDINPKGNFQLHLKTYLLFLGVLLLYVSLVFYTPNSLWICTTLCVLLGINFALIGFNVSHDACHGSYSEDKWLNSLLGYSFNILGVSSFFWKTKHNLVHHTYTNIDGIDGDIIQTKMLRLAPTQKKWWIHQYQYLYCSFLYAVSYIAWVFLNDFEKYASVSVHKTKIVGFNAKEKTLFWVFKLIYVVLFLVIPVYFVGLVALVGYIIMGLSCGLLLGMVFQLAHVVETTEFEDATLCDLSVENEWAIHQFKTTSDFAPNNRFVSYLVGGLNFQVVHHIFPQISHVYYPQIQPIIKKVCERYHVEYKSFESVSLALASHFRQMKYLGTC